MSGYLSVIISSNGKLYSVLKGGSPVKDEKLQECIDRTKERVQEVVALLKQGKKKKMRA